MFILFYVSVCL